MTLLFALVLVAVLLSWKPLTRLIPSDSILAFGLTGIVVVALFQFGKVG